MTDIFVRKNRNGPIGNVELMFNKNNQKFVTIDRNIAESSGF